MINLKSILAVCVSVAAGLVYAAAFMPWSEWSGSSIQGGRNAPGVDMPPSLTAHFWINGWNVTMDIVGVFLPGWAVVPLALAAAALAWLAVSPWRPPRFLGPVLASVGFLQASLTAVLAASPGMTVGIGAPLTVIAFLAILICSFAQAIKIGPRAD